MSWYRKVVADWNNIPQCLDHFEKELAEARTEVKIKGNVERNSTELPAYVELRFSQRLQENITIFPQFGQSNENSFS